MKRTTLVSLAFLLLAAPAMAHDAKPLHGGKIAFAGHFHVEMVAKGEAVEVYLIDHHNKPMPVAGYKGLAILSADGKSQRIPLETADGQSLTGKAGMALPTEPKGVVQITPPDGKPVSVKF